MNDLLNKNSVKIVSNFLNEFDAKISIILLKNTSRSAQEAAESLNVETGAIVKSLIFKTINNEFFLCLVSGDKQVSLDKIYQIFKKDIIKPDADEVKEFTGFSIGGVPPIAHKKKIKTYIDISLNRFNKLFAAAGHPYCVFEITFEKLCKISDGEIIDIIS